MYYIDDSTKILTKELAIKVIDEISDMDLDEIAKQVMEDNNKWNQYKKLV